MRLLSISDFISSNRRIELDLYPNESQFEKFEFDSSSYTVNNNVLEILKPTVEFDSNSVDTRVSILSGNNLRITAHSTTTYNEYNIKGTLYFKNGRTAQIQIRVIINLTF